MDQVWGILCSCLTWDFLFLIQLSFCIISHCWPTNTSLLSKNFSLSFSFHDTVLWIPCHLSLVSGLAFFLFPFLGYSALCLSLCAVSPLQGQSWWLICIWVHNASLAHSRCSVDGWLREAWFTPSYYRVIWLLRQLISCVMACSFLALKITHIFWMSQ